MTVGAVSISYLSITTAKIGWNDTAREEELGKVPSSTGAVIDRGSTPEVTSGAVWSIAGDKRNYRNGSATLGSRMGACYVGAVLV